MPTIIEMPKLSDTMTTGTVVKWLKNEGDVVKSGDIVALIETDKSTMDLEVFDSGTLLKIIAPAGAVVSCKGPIGVIGAKGEKIDESLLKPALVGAASAPAPGAASMTPSSSSSSINVPKDAPSSSSSRIKASPLAKKVAKEVGVDLDRLSGSGPSGRIVRSDVLSASANGSSIAAGASNWGVSTPGQIAREERVILTNIRQTIARRLLESKTQIPHFYLSIEIDASHLVNLRSSLNETLGKLAKPYKLSLNDFIMKASVEAIRKIPAVNASFEGDAIHQFGDIQLAFAVAIDGGLITPIIRQAQEKNLKSLSDETKVLAAKAKEGKLKPEEYTGGTFTISNLGMYGIDQFNAIINPPQAAILAVGNVLKKPVVNDQDQIVVGHRLTLTLSCDHRVVDGAIGAQFLNELRRLLENPALLLL